MELWLASRILSQRKFSEHLFQRQHIYIIYHGDAVGDIASEITDPGSRGFSGNLSATMIHVQRANRKDSLTWQTVFALTPMDTLKIVEKIEFESILLP